MYNYTPDDIRTMEISGIEHKITEAIANLQQQISNLTSKLRDIQSVVDYLRIQKEPTMRVIHVIMRLTANGWSAVRFNVPENNVEHECQAMIEQEPKTKLKVIRITEEVIREDK